MNIRLLGAHNLESQSTKYISLLIDDILAIDAGGLTSSLSFAAQQELKAVLLTHHHYDHVRDIPAIGMNLALQKRAINIYGTISTYEVLSTHLLDGKLYRKFLEQPEENPTFKFTIVEPGKAEQIEDYSVLAIPVNHVVPAVGYQITSADGKAVFYTSDTGPGLDDCWKDVSLQLLITEVTLPNSYEDFAIVKGHLTPALLKQELINFQEVKGYLPRVVVVHMTPWHEKEIESEAATVAEELGNSITLGYEGMQLHL